MTTSLEIFWISLQHSGLRSRCRSRKESEVFGWSRIPTTLGVEVAVEFFVRPRPRKCNWINFLHQAPKLGIHIEMVQFLLKFFWNREFLLCAAISIEFYKLLQNCWQPNFIHFMFRNRSRCRRFWRGRSWSQTFQLRLRNPESILFLNACFRSWWYTRSRNRPSI